MLVKSETISLLILIQKLQLALAQDFGKLFKKILQL